MKRLLYLTLAAGIIVWGFGALEARAGQIPLPTTLDQLLPAGNFVVTGLEPDTFSNFSFSSSAIPPSTPVLTAAGITVDKFGPTGNESGLQFSGAMIAPAGAIVDYSIGYTVTAPAGLKISDALVVGTFSTFGGTGTASVGETLLFPDKTSLQLEASKPGSPSQEIFFPGVSSIIVTKDIILTGGSNGASVSIIGQGFSSTTIPEPASMALLGIGISGLFALRRFFKRPSVA